MDAELRTWWLLLCAVAAFNLCLLAVSGLRLRSRGEDVSAGRWLLFWLSAVYAAGCAFRSVLPMVDLPRICLHDTWISRIVVGRTVATIAELCFAWQCALILREAAEGRGMAAFAARLIVPIIVAAEVSSWAAVVTSNWLLHAVENSLWTLAAVLSLGGLLSLRSQFSARTVRFIEAACACAGGYVAYMVLVDVPMYLSRWQSDPAGDGSLPLVQGLRTLVARCSVEPRWEVWSGDALWLTLYFTLAVWISLSLPHAPALRSRKYE